MTYDITSRFFQWMEAHGIPRSEGAALLGVDERSLSTYRSRGLPRRKHARAEQIMREHHAAARAVTDAAAENRINIPLSDADLDTLTHAARIVGELDIRHFIRRSATHRAKEIIAKQGTLKVAEDPAPYRTKKGNGTEGKG